MDIKGRWTEEGDFELVDADDHDAVLIEVILHEPFTALAADNANHIARAIVGAMVQTPHPDSGSPMLGGRVPLS